jgi:hypothetical protein
LELYESTFVDTIIIIILDGITLTDIKTILIALELRIRISCTTELGCIATSGSPKFRL